MDDYKRLAAEWGRKARKEQSREKRGRLGIPDEEASNGPARKKDTKKWCKGKVGRPHKLVCKKWSDVVSQTPQDSTSHIRWRDNYRVLICERCSKQVDFWYGGRGKNRPEWVDK